MFKATYMFNCTEKFRHCLAVQSAELAVIHHAQVVVEVCQVSLISISSDTEHT